MSRAYETWECPRCHRLLTTYTRMTCPPTCLNKDVHSNTTYEMVKVNLK